MDESEKNDMAAFGQISQLQLKWEGIIDRPNLVVTWSLLHRRQICIIW